MVLILKP